MNRPEQSGLDQVAGDLSKLPAPVGVNPYGQYLCPLCGTPTYRVIAAVPGRRGCGRPSCREPGSAG